MPICYGPHDLQTNTGESVEDTARILAEFLDILVIRTATSAEEPRIFAAQRTMSVINAMSAIEHPTQALADLSALTEHFGELRGINVLYVGEGNNTANALVLALSRVEGARLTILAPVGYGVPCDVIAKARALASNSGAEICQYDNIAAFPRNVDVVYTSRWQTTGSYKPDPDWRRMFEPFKVTKDLMCQVSKPSGTVFMHDLPVVRGEEVERDIIDGQQSIAFRQATHKLFSAMAVLEWCAIANSNLAEALSTPARV
jgi:ornithine carbamoyltransferase